MDEEKFNEYVSGRYKSEIEWYDQRSMKYQKYYKISQWLIIIFSSITPIFIVLSYQFPTGYVNGIAVSTSVIVAISSAILRTFRFYDNWINYRTICETLKKEIYLYDAKIDEYREVEDPKALFVERVETLISRENTLWISTFKKDENK